MTRRIIALTVCAALVGGCASAGGPRVAPGGPGQPAAAHPSTDPAVMAEYVQKLQLGTRVRVDLASGRAIKGTLMKATDRAIIVQTRTRLPEPPLEILLTDILAVTPESSGGGIGKAIGIGAAAGGAAALGVILLLIAIFSD
jgi:hypothetical protein